MMKTNVFKQAPGFLFLIAFSGAAAASSGIMLYGVPVSNTFFVSLYCFFAAFYYAHRAHLYRRSVLLWWFFGLFLSLSLLVVAVILVKILLPYVSMFAENIIALFAAVLLTGVVARVLVSRFDTSILTSVCLMASIPVVLAAYVSAFDIHGSSLPVVAGQEENQTRAVKKTGRIETASAPSHTAAMVGDELEKSQATRPGTDSRQVVQVKEKVREKAEETVVTRTKTPAAADKTLPVVHKKTRPARRSARSTRRLRHSRLRRGRRLARKNRSPRAVAARRNWVIQVASFSVRNNARRLKNKLDRNGYKVFIAKENRVDRDMYRVRVGPVFDRSEADSLIRKLGSEQNLSGIVLRYE